jgi:hypothetical protein
MSKKAKRTSALNVPLVEVLKDVPWFRVEGHENSRLRKFSGPLQTPIIQSLSDQPVIDGVAHIDGAMNSIFSQRIDKLILLLKHYKLEDTDDPWLLLSLRLACAVVPGLRVVTKAPRGRGRPQGPKKWTREARNELLAAVDAVRNKQKGLSIASAINILKKDPRWKTLTKQRYYDAVQDRKLYERVERRLMKIKRS